MIGMGEVFRARDTRLNRDVAVKARSSSRQDFRRRIPHVPRET